MTDSPAFVSSRMRREMIENYERWHRQRYPEDYEEGVHLDLVSKKHGATSLWLRDDQRLTLDQWQRLLPASRKLVRPHQLPEGVEAGESKTSSGGPRT